MMAMITNRHNKAPKFASVEAALGALAHGVRTEVLITLTPDAASTWKVKTKRGYVIRFGDWYGIARTLTSATVSLPPASGIARIDYGVGHSRQEYAPFYVRGEGE